MTSKKAATKTASQKPAKKSKANPVAKAAKTISKNTGAQKPSMLHQYFHKDGSLWARGELREGVMQGSWEWFRKDGSRMRAGSFTDGVQTGAWTTYARDGHVVKVTQMKAK